jgi:hypothetical protein
MRINAAGHDVTAGGIEHGVTREILPDPGDDAVFDSYIGDIAAIGDNDSAALDDFAGHGVMPFPNSYFGI